ncbi:MAG: metal ABC transporter ATP-binding protein [Halanaerobiaceae bacterium]
MAMIEMDSVEVNYGHLRAVSDVNLRVEEGEILGVIGPNGGGKSTLLKLAAGILNPDKGRVEVDCRPGYVPQSLNFARYTPLSVREVVLSGRLEGGINFFHRYDSEDMEKVEYLMDKLNISGLADKQVGALSGGEFKKMLMARALAGESELLLLDEPLVNIDIAARRELYGLLGDLNCKITIVVATHDFSFATDYFERVVFLDRKIYFQGRMDEVEKNMFSTGFFKEELLRT